MIGITGLRGFLGRRSIGLHLGVLTLLTVLAVLAWWRVWVTGHPTSTITCACGDPSQELWLFAWIPYAMSHGINPLFTSLLEAGQGGVNLMWDGNSLLASLLLAPVTVVFGPIASFNVAAIVGPVLSGWCFFLAVRRITRFVPGQVASAVLYGFSPFLIYNSPYGHLQLTWLFFPPLLFLLLYELCLVPSRRPAVIGCWLGALVVVQFLSGTEVLVISAIGVVIGGAIAVALAPRAAWALRRRIGIAAAWTAGISVCLLAYPAWFAADGPRHIVGSPWPSLNLPSRGVAASTILTVGPAFHHGNIVSEAYGYYGAAGPPLLFLGFGLLTFLFVSAIVWYRDRLAWIMVGMGGITTLLSLGTVFITVGIGNQLPSTGRWWLVWHLFGHLPIFRDLEPSRFAILAGFAAATLLAISADRWWQLGTSRSAGRLTRRINVWFATRRAAWGAVITLAMGCVLWTVAEAYTLPYVVHREAEPTWFTKDAPHLSAGTRVLVLPTDFRTVTNVMSWQAEEGLPFALEGGYAIIPGENSPLFYSMAPQGAAAVLDALTSGHREPLSRTAEVRGALKRWGVRVVIMNDTVADPDHIMAFVTTVLGQAPRRVDGLWVWTLATKG